MLDFSIIRYSERFWSRDPTCSFPYIIYIDTALFCSWRWCVSRTVTVKTPVSIPLFCSVFSIHRFRVCDETTSWGLFQKTNKAFSYFRKSFLFDMYWSLLKQYRLPDCLEKTAIIMLVELCCVLKFWIELASWFLFEPPFFFAISYVYCR